VELVLDANVLFAALIKDGETRKFILLNNHSFHIPEFTFDEMLEHTRELEDKIGLPANEIGLILEHIIFTGKIRIVPLAEFSDFTKRAMDLCPDPDDTAYVALAMKLNIPLWSNDARLRDQEQIKIYRSKDILQ
jgi:predicted nucleic acid-binding protein